MKNKKIKYLLSFLFSALFLSHLLYANTYETYKKMYEDGAKENALSGFKQLIKENPRHKNIADMEFFLAENEENYMKAITAFKSIYDKRTSFSRRAEAGYNAGNLYLLNNGYNNAANMFSKVANDYPDSKYATLSKLKKASIKLKLQDKDEAIMIYKQIISAENDKKSDVYLEALFGLANVYFQMERYYEALGNYNKLVEDGKYFKERAFALYRLAICYENTNAKDKAVNTYSLVVNVYPNTQSALLASQRLKVYAADTEAEETQEKKEQKLSPPVIYKTSKENVYQLGRFRDKEKALKLIDIVSSLGYKAYITDEKIQNDTSYLVRLSVFDDARNIAEMRKRLGSENIPFFKVN